MGNYDLWDTRMLSADHGHPHGERFGNHGRQSFTVAVGGCHARHAYDSCSSQRLTNDRSQVGHREIGSVGSVRLQVLPEMDAEARLR